MSTPKGGRLGLGQTAANTLLKLYEMPSDLGLATVSLHMHNPNSTPIHYTAYITSGAEPTDADRIDEGKALAAMTAVSLRCRVMGPGEKLFVRTTESGLVCRVEGEEANQSTTGGCLGKATVASAGTPTAIATVGSTVGLAIASIYVFNPTDVAIDTTVYISQGDTPAAAEAVLPTDAIAAGGTLEITCRQLSAGEKVIVRASNAGGLLARVEGYTVASAG